jgi:hypothetical protein
MQLETSCKAEDFFHPEVVDIRLSGCWKGYWRPLKKQLMPDDNVLGCYRPLNTKSDHMIVESLFSWHCQALQRQLVDLHPPPKKNLSILNRNGSYCTVKSCNFVILL